LLPVGPIAEGGAVIVQLGAMAKERNFISEPVADVLQGCGIFIGLILWGYAIVWIVFSIVAITSRLRKLKFTMTWWAFTFPLGMYPLSLNLKVGCFASCSAQIGRALSQQFFKVLATVVTVGVIILWAMVAIRTAIEGWKGSIFNAPYVPSEDRSVVLINPRGSEVTTPATDLEMCTI
jgi:tellurite resistance protein TehA-like permease